MMTIYRSPTNNAIVISPEEASRMGFSTFEVESIPDGEGRLMTDGVNVWREPTVENEEPSALPDPVTQNQLALAELAEMMDSMATRYELALAELAEATLGGGA